MIRQHHMSACNVAVRPAPCKHPAPPTHHIPAEHVHVLRPAATNITCISVKFSNNIVWYDAVGALNNGANNVGNVDDGSSSSQSIRRVAMLTMAAVLVRVYCFTGAVDGYQRTLKRFAAGRLKSLNAKTRTCQVQSSPLWLTAEPAALAAQALLVPQAALPVVPAASPAASAHAWLAAPATSATSVAQASLAGTAG